MENDFVSVIIVMRNEELFIEKCIESIVNQDYPKDLYEVIVVDGESTDNSVKIVEDYGKMNNIKIKILSNPKKNLASGWNLGIKNAKGDIVVRPDAHSTIEKDFLSKSVETLNENDAICVGGKINSVCTGGYLAKAISCVLSSPFGVGNSQFRIGNKAQYVDTVAYGAYRKEVFKEVGYFNESLERNQDLEMHSRIKKIGGKFYFNPEIKSDYFTRSTYKGFVSQAFKNGKWNIITLNWQKSALSIRHFVPLIFTLSLLINFIFTLIFSPWKYILILEVSLYILGIIYGLTGIIKENNYRYIFVAPILFLSLHISYGLGSMIGIVDYINMKVSNSYNNRVDDQKSLGV